MRPKDCIFNVTHDPDLGYYVVVIKKDTEDYFYYEKTIDRIIPSGFYKINNDENIYAFDMKPEEARETLKRLGFEEDLSLV